MLTKVGRTYFSSFRTISNVVFDARVTYLAGPGKLRPGKCWARPAPSLLYCMAIWGPTTKAQKQGWPQLVFRTVRVPLNSRNGIRSWLFGLPLYTGDGKQVLLLREKKKKKSNGMVYTDAKKKIGNSPSAREKHYLKHFPLSTQTR